MPLEDHATERWVGRRLRAARRQRDLTLAFVAEQVGVSGAHLSRLEKGERQPSIGVLLELARAYRTSIGELLGEEPTSSSYHLVRAGSARAVDSPDGPYTTISGLGPGAALGAVHLRIPVGVDNPRPAQHLGEELVYVIRGDLDVNLDGEKLSLTSGDALHFDARTPHLLTNSSTETAEVLVVSTPASTEHRPD